MYTHTQIKNTQAGFSLIEILVSLAVFAIIITAGATAVLGIVDANQKANSLNAVMTNMYTALESMAREIRLGTDYQQNCSNGINVDQCISFISSTGRNVIYEFNPDDESIEQTIGTDFPTALTSPEITIETLKFTLHNTGSNPDQDMVTLLVKGKALITEKTGTEFTIQTTMSQRILGTEQ